MLFLGDTPPLPENKDLTFKKMLFLNSYFISTTSLFSADALNANAGVSHPSHHRRVGLHASVRHLSISVLSGGRRGRQGRDVWSHAEEVWVDWKDQSGVEEAERSPEALPDVSLHLRSSLEDRGTRLSNVLFTKHLEHLFKSPFTYSSCI